MLVFMLRGENTSPSYADPRPPEDVSAENSRVPLFLFGPQIPDGFFSNSNTESLGHHNVPVIRLPSSKKILSFSYWLIGYPDCRGRQKLRRKGSKSKVATPIGPPLPPLSKERRGYNV